MECEREHTPTKYIKHAKTFLGDATPFLDYVTKKGAGESKGSGAADFGQYL